MHHYFYLTIDFCCFIIPFLFSYHHRIQFNRYHRAVIVAIALMMTVFIPWDAVFTQMGIWGFNTDYILGTEIIYLPVEEWLFFICIPYACLFTYHVIGNSISKRIAIRHWRTIAAILALTMFLISFAHIHQLYSMSAHFLCGALLIAHVFILRSDYIGKFLATFIVVLVPFIISNGLLTGIRFWEYPIFNTSPETIKDMIVWYNNDHNLGFRIFSIPLDDIAYGMSMLLLVTTVFEMRKKSGKISFLQKTS